MNLFHLSRKCFNVARVTGYFIRQEQSRLKHFQDYQVETKGYNDFVTYVDKIAEKRIVTKLKALVPEAGFLTEENTEFDLDKELTWIIDPLDGTTNFIHGVPCFSISIALQRRREIILGIVYEVNSDSCFVAYKGGGAFLNNKPIHVSDKTTLADSLISTGFPVRDLTHLDDYMEVFKQLLQKTQGVRRFGSAATDLAYVAMGAFDGFFEYNLSPWDVAAGSLLVKEAGGIVTDFNGYDEYIFGKQIIASAPDIMDEFRGIVVNSLIV